MIELFLLFALFNIPIMATAASTTSDAFLADAASQPHDPSSQTTAPSDDGHDHADHSHGSSASGLDKVVSWLGKFHPAATDFPIAMLIGAAMAELMLILTGRRMFGSAAKFMVWLGCASAVFAVALGWFYAGFRWSDSSWVMTVHRWLGTGVGLWALVLLLLCIAAHREGGKGERFRPWYRVSLFVGAAGVGLNGFFGGALVYGLNHYAW